MNHLLCFGFGFSARAFAARLDKRVWKISATSRDAEGIAEIDALGLHGVLFDNTLQIASDVTHLLISAPPGENGDPVLQLFGEQLQRLSKQLKWVGYLSTTGVYGDRGGDWVDEESPLEPNTARGQRRLEAELSPMAKSFYAESKRVSNRRIKTELGYKFLYPNYRDGLRSLKSTLTA